MGDEKKKKTFLKKSPSGTLPKREKNDSLLLDLNKKMKDNIDKLKKCR
ncbi:hypothetical protein [Niallia circulans]|nr:hypothetical protein [Niallia circulans]